MSANINEPTRRVPGTLWVGLSILVLAIAAVVLLSQFQTKPLPVYDTVLGFTLTNQNGETVTLDNFRGHIWIADAIFTRCPGQCLVMSAHMKEIQDALPAGQSVQLVSLTTDPAFDQPPVLKQYARRFGAADDRWSFLTGDKKSLHTMEVDSLKLTVLDKPASEQENAADLFVHSEKFVLLDKLGRIRGYYDGQTPGAVGQVLAGVRKLARE